jgi:hypothetical protein
MSGGSTPDATASDHAPDDCDEIDAEPLLRYLKIHGSAGLGTCHAVLGLPPTQSLSCLARSLQESGMFRRRKSKATGKQYWTLAGAVTA